MWWSSAKSSVCDSQKPIETVLLCHHSTDDLKVNKLKHTIWELGPVTVKSKNEHTKVEEGFKEDLVIFCLSADYVQRSEHFFNDVSSLMEGDGKNGVSYFMMEDSYQDLKKDLASKGIKKENVLFFDDPDDPSIFQIHRRKKKENSKKKIVYVSGCWDAAPKMEHVQKLTSSFTTVMCHFPRKTRSISRMSKEDWSMITEKMISSDQYLIMMSDDYFCDEITSIECELIRRRGKVIHIIDVRKSKEREVPMWIRSMRIIPYDKNDDVLNVLLLHLLEEQQGHDTIIISFHPSDLTNAEQCLTMFRNGLSQCHVRLSSDFPDSKTLFHQIMKCQALILCLSEAFMGDKKCRKEVELAHVMWKKLMPLNLQSSPAQMERPDWLIKIIGYHQYANQEEINDILSQNVLLNKDNLKIENWIQRNITVPLHPEISTQISTCRSCGGGPQHTMTDAFGKVEVFAEGGLERRAAMYVRLSTNSDLKTVASLIIDQWGLERPRLLISVTGEGSQIINNPSKSRVLTNALQNIVKEKGVWFTTDGATSEISKVIGQVVEKEDVNERPTVIGIASWEYLKMNENLVIKHGFGRWPATYSTREAIKASGAYHLNPFCSHFLLPHKCAVVNENGESSVISTARFRTEFEEYIRQGKYALQKSRCPEAIPSLLLVVGGDPLQSLSMVKRSLDLRRPVVVLRGTGGFADTLANAFTKGRTEEPKILEILTHPARQHLSFVNLNDDRCQLGHTILDVLLSSISDDEQKLSLALGFDNSEKAMEHVFFDNKKTQCLEESFVTDLMLKAMREEKVDFVRLLIAECVDIEKFQLNNKDKLYTSKYLPDELRRQLGWDTIPTIENIRCFVVRMLAMDVFVEYDVNMDIRDHQVDPYFYLMVWSLLMMNLRDLSIFFWQHCKEPLPSALIASGILRQLRKGCQVTNRILADKLFKHEKEFVKLSCDVLQQFFEDNPEDTERFLMKPRPRWRNLSCMEIAFRLKHRPFMAHEACKIPIYKIWFGRISPENNSLRMIISVFFLGMFPFVLKFIDVSPNQSGNKNEASCCSSICNKVRTRIVEFYTAPIMRFSHTMASYLLFLTLFSYTLLAGFSDHFHWRAVLLYCWVATLMLDQIRELLNGIDENKIFFGHKYRRERPSVVQVYFRDKWNYFDVTILCFYIIALALSFVPSYAAVEFGRVFMAMSLIAFFMRILKTFSAIEELGPKLWMIAAMAKDLMFFVIILMVFVVSYAIAAYSVIYPESDVDWDLIANVLRLGYWNLYGELLLEDLEAKEPECSFDPAVYSSGILPRCAVKHRRLVGMAMMGIYLLFANVMLLNILIAMFSDTYQRVQTQRNQKWNYERYALVKEFQRVPVIPMPVGALIYIHYLIRWIYRKCKRCTVVSNTEKVLLGKELNENETINCMERECVYLFMKKKREESDAQKQITAQDVSNIVSEQLTMRINRLQSLTETQLLSKIPETMK
ncbi:transient receptor potential cation channel subfamily M member-like 2 [Saccostrea echinata]|uniref:transient receptor potential cation channel subfamily M member-like 2 n=1 Tax=Saccostrea echinata TaxID=191078 RepID=UPI002A808AD0|nr:transient receptor potential cation channel subfamily M member-like 2 [Saccostrea echinata]